MPNNPDPADPQQSIIDAPEPIEVAQASKVDPPKPIAGNPAPVQDTTPDKEPTLRDYAIEAGQLLLVAVFGVLGGFLSWVLNENEFFPTPFYYSLSIGAAAAILGVFIITTFDAKIWRRGLAFALTFGLCGLPILDKALSMVGGQTEESHTLENSGNDLKAALLKLKPDSTKDNGSITGDTTSQIHLLEFQMRQCLLIGSSSSNMAVKSQASSILLQQIWALPAYSNSNPGDVIILCQNIKKLPQAPTKIAGLLNDLINLVPQSSDTGFWVRIASRTSSNDVWTSWLIAPPKTPLEPGVKLSELKDKFKESVLSTDVYVRNRCAQPSPNSDSGLSFGTAVFIALEATPIRIKDMAIVNGTLGYQQIWAQIEPDTAKWKPVTDSAPTPISPASQK